MNSPVKMVAEAVSKVPGVSVEAIARREKAALSEAVAELTTRRRVPRWMDKSARNRALSLFKRNTSGIGKTNIKFALRDRADATIVDRTAREAVRTLENYERDLAESVADKSRIEVGSIEANFLSGDPHYGRPAIRVKDRLTGTEIVCVLSDELAEQAGVEHNLWDIWKNKRIMIAGEIKYGRDGMVERIKAVHIRRVDAPVLKEEDIIDPTFTSGMTPYEYLSAIRRIDGA